MGKQKDSQVIVLIFLSSVGAGALFYKCTVYQGDLQAVCMGLMLSLVSLVSLDLLSLRPADSHTVHTLFTQYMYIVRLRVAWISCKWRWYTTSRNPAGAQEKALQYILQSNQNTEHGKKYKLGTLKSRAEFVSVFPLTDYKHYDDYVERIGKGEKNVLTADEVVFLATTSGTTGKNKVYPLTGVYVNQAKACLLETNSLQTGFYTMRRVHQFRLASVDKQSPCGLQMGGAGIISQFPPEHNLSPLIYLKMYQEKQSYYTQAVYMMSDEELSLLLGYSSTLMYTFFKFMEHHWQELCDVIETGKIADMSLFDDEVRVELQSHLRPNPKRADHLRGLLAGGIGGMATRVWPHLENVLLAKTGSFKHCADILMNTYLKGVSMFYTRHASTEAFMGLSLEKNNCGDIFTLTADMSFLEFIDIDDVDSDNPRTHFLEQLEKGKAYEIVVTSLHGIYRYRLGDVIKVVGHYNSIPKYIFQYRLGERLNFAFERTPDQMVYRAVKSCIARLPDELTLVEFSATESFNLEQLTGERCMDNHYIIFIEVSHPAQQNYCLPEDFTYAVDMELQMVHQPYAMYRDKGNIAMLKVIQVRHDAFNALKKSLWDGRQHSQFKMPRVVRRDFLLQVLLDHRM